MIDTHCHLEMSAFEGDREDVIKRALEAGIEAFINIGSDLEGNKGSVALAEKHDFIYAAVGIHPHNAIDFNEEIFNQIKEWAGACARKEWARKQDGVVAIGEIGLDYHYDHSPREIQRSVFRKQLDYARKPAFL